MGYLQASVLNWTICYCYRYRDVHVDMRRREEGPPDLTVDSFALALIETRKVQRVQNLWDETLLQGLPYFNF